MRVLFVSGELIGSAVVHQLIKEGHEVKLYIDHKDRKHCLDGLVEKTDNWKDELYWVGTDGLIVFDDVIFDGAQDSLRKQGFSVYGGNAQGDKLEMDREFFQHVLDAQDVLVLPSFDFSNADDAIAFVEKELGKWVVKQNSHIGMLNYVGQREDSKDVLNILKSYKEKNISPVHLQKKVDGVEVATGRYFNGTDWVGPIKVNFEHKRLCNGDIGPLTAEMGTLAWYDDNENLPIYRETLAKLKPYLQSIDYRGDVDINCIANKLGVWPLEATMRFGTPSTELHCELNQSPWGELMKAVADGKEYDLKYKKGYGIVVSVAVPPFPFAPKEFHENDVAISEGTDIFFKRDLTNDEWGKIHFEEISQKTSPDGTEKQYYLSGKHGYALYVTGHGETVNEARHEAYSVIDQLIIPKMFYRTDIGEKFVSEDHERLKSWGWI